MNLEFSILSEVRVEMAGGKVKHVQLLPKLEESGKLSSADWQLDFDQLENTITKL